MVDASVMGARDIRRAHRLAIANGLEQALSLPDHLASGAVGLSNAPFESTHNSRTLGDPVTDSPSSIAPLSDQLAAACAPASASVVALHARPRLPPTGRHLGD